MVGIHIHQIYYSEQTYRSNDNGFIKLGNLANERPDWREYWSIRHYLLNNILDENDYYGFFSPRFKAKTNLDAPTVYEFIRKYAAETDVFLFSPLFDQGAFCINIFEQGQHSRPGIMPIFQDCVAKIAPTVNLATLVMDSRNIVFCNYIVAKPAFWKAWLQKCEIFFVIAEEDKTLLAIHLNAITSHHSGDAPNKVFVIERIASLLLSTQPHWKVKSYDSTQLPYSDAGISKYPNQLFQLDALKMASSLQAHPQYLAAFSALRQWIINDIQQAAD